MAESFKGYSDAHRFREANEYEKTEALFEQLGLDGVGDRIPTVGINVARLAKMAKVQALSNEIAGKKLQVAIFGISSPKGPKDFERLLKALGAQKVSTVALDISNGIFGKINKSDLDEILCVQADARGSGLTSSSQDIILRDHLGNCCPPEIDRAIDKEVRRVLKPGGISIVNITTNELLKESPQRQLIHFDDLITDLGPEFIAALQTSIYDLEDLSKRFPQLNAEDFRGPILEIEPNNSFVVFGEEQQGHGEWFRSLDDHLNLWEIDGFKVEDINITVGWDTHNPPLRCQRHNVIMKKL